MASVPIALVILAMAGLRWRAATAGLMGLACALILGVWIFDLGATFGPAVAVGGAMAEALFTTTTILWIIFPALCIYEAQQRSGAFDVIGDALAGLSDDPRIQVLLVAWFFGLFMEGVAGFGTPVALAAPILVGLGFSPVRALTLALIGHAAGVSFGAIGTPVVPLVTATGLSSVTLARDAAILHSLVGPALVIVLFVMAGGAGRGPQTVVTLETRFRGRIDTLRRYLRVLRIMEVLAVPSKRLVPEQNDADADLVFTPQNLAEDLIAAFASEISGIVLDPSRGNGAISSRKPSDMPICRKRNKMWAVPISRLGWALRKTF
nr:L-lactate permease [Loktanella sp. SALINAS62]